MKSFFLTILILAFATVSYGATIQSFTAYSAASAKTTYTPVVKTTGQTIKSLMVTGILNPANQTTFKNMSGTVTTECGPSTNGPWGSCVSDGYAQTAVSRTTNGNFSWRDAVTYVRVKWVTTGLTRNYIKVWLGLSE